MAFDEGLPHSPRNPELSPESSDAALVLLARKGEEKAFEELFERHYAVVRGFAARLLLDTNLAEDVAQDTFLRAANSLETIKDAKGFRSWLFRVAANLCRDQIRSRTRRGLREMDFAASIHHHHQQSGEDDASRRVMEAMGALPPLLREAVVLVYYENLPHSEAGRIAGCAASTISWRVMLAKRQLKTFLSK